jgi:uncharacterized membrane protein
MLKRLRVVRVETTSDNNRRIVGLFVPKAAVDTVLQGFFLSLSILTPFLHCLNFGQIIFSKVMRILIYLLLTSVDLQYVIVLDD